MRGVGGGGKALSGKQVGEVGLEGGLVALDRQQIVPASLEEDLPGRFILGVQRVGHRDLALQGWPAQQLARGRDFVAPGGGHDTAQKTSLRVHGIDDLHPGVTQFLAVENDDPILTGAQDLLLPAQEHRLDPIVIDLRQHPAEGGLAGAPRLAGVRVGTEAQGAQLGRTQRVGVVGQVLGATHDPLGGGHDHQAEQPG